MDKDGGFKIDNKLEEMLNSQLVLWMFLSVVKTNEHYRMLYDVKGRFTLSPN
jgi:ribosomal protein S4E